MLPLCTLEQNPLLIAVYILFRSVWRSGLTQLRIRYEPYIIIPSRKYVYLQYWTKKTRQSSLYSIASASYTYLYRLRWFMHGETRRMQAQRPKLLRGCNMLRYTSNMHLYCLVFFYSFFFCFKTNPPADPLNCHR